MFSLDIIPAHLSTQDSLEPLILSPRSILIENLLLITLRLALRLLIIEQNKVLMHHIFSTRLYAHMKLQILHNSFKELVDDGAHNI